MIYGDGEPSSVAQKAAFHHVPGTLKLTEQFAPKKFRAFQ